MLLKTSGIPTLLAQSKLNGPAVPRIQCRPIDVHADRRSGIYDTGCNSGALHVWPPQGGGGGIPLSTSLEITGTDLGKELFEESVGTATERTLRKAFGFSQPDGLNTGNLGATYVSQFPMLQLSSQLAGNLQTWYV